MPVTCFRMFQTRGQLVLCGQHDLLKVLWGEPDFRAFVERRLQLTLGQIDREMRRKPERKQKN